MMTEWLIGGFAVLAIVTTALVTFGIERSASRWEGLKRPGVRGAPRTSEQLPATAANNDWLTRIVSAFED